METSTRLLFALYISQPRPPRTDVLWGVQRSIRLRRTRFLFIPLSQKGDLPLRMETKGRHGGLPLLQSGLDLGGQQDRRYMCEGIEGAAC